MKVGVNVLADGLNENDLALALSFDLGFAGCLSVSGLALGDSFLAAVAGASSFLGAFYASVVAGLALVAAVVFGLVSDLVSLASLVLVSLDSFSVSPSFAGALPASDFATIAAQFIFLGAAAAAVPVAAAGA